MHIWQVVLIGGASLMLGFILGWIIRPNTDEVNEINADYYQAAYHDMRDATGMEVNPYTGDVEKITE